MTTKTTLASGGSGMSRAYKARREQCKARLDAELLEMAKRTGHHGAANFIEYARQRCNVAITAEYAADLLARAGFPK